MKRVCDYCKGQKRWLTGVSMVTGEEFYATCPVCHGTGWQGEDDPVISEKSEQEKLTQATQQFKHNILHEPLKKAAREAISMAPRINR